MIVCRLKRLLTKKGITRYEVQKHSGITYAVLSKMYRGESISYNASVLDRLCLVLKCQPGDLLEWKPPVRFPRERKKGS